MFYPTVYIFIGFIDYVLFIEKFKYFVQTIISYSRSKVDEKLTLFESFNWNFLIAWLSKYVLYFLEVFNSRPTTVLLVLWLINYCFSKKKENILQVTILLTSFLIRKNLLFGYQSNYISVEIPHMHLTCILCQLTIHKVKPQQPHTLFLFNELLCNEIKQLKKYSNKIKLKFHCLCRPFVFNIPAINNIICVICE